MNKTPKINNILLLTPICLAISIPAIADNNINENLNSQSANAQNSDLQDSYNQNTSQKYSIETAIPEEENTSTINDLNDEATKWADNKREKVQNRLGDWAYKMDDWFGEPDPNNPASANLRIVLDTRWVDDPIEGSNVTVKPRIRGRLKLPVLERRLSLIIGDEDLDEEKILTKGSKAAYFDRDGSAQNKTFDRKQARDDNTSIALRWSKIEETLGFDADIGVRSRDDIYLKFSVDKDLYEADKWRISSNNFYRYGSQSEHTLKGELNFQYLQDHNSFLNNNINIRYQHEGEEEETTWSDELRQIHTFGKNKTLSYGISAYGDFEHSEPSLNSYGPTISYRQPFWRDWLFLQTELNYYNDKEQNKDHFPSALIRLEALF